MIKGIVLFAFGLAACTFVGRDPHHPEGTPQGGGEESGDTPQANGGPGGGQTTHVTTQAASTTGSDCGESNFGLTSLTPGFMPDPATAAGQSGGNVNATQLGQSQTGPCTGWIAQRPDHTMYLAQPFEYMQVLVQSTDDTTLVIQGPDGSWCSDDEGGGRNPTVKGGWVAGCYRVWVGSYQEGQESDYQISFTERR
jgi:hypothetical protein